MVGVRLILQIKIGSKLSSSRSISFYCRFVLILSMIAVLDKMHVERPALLNSSRIGKRSALTIARLHP